MTKPKSKKSETIEFRLAHDSKQALMAHCQAKGQTASELLRLLIEREMACGATRLQQGLIGWRALVVAVAGGLALGAVAVPSLAQPATSRADFEQRDRDGDGLLSFDEFRAP